VPFNERIIFRRIIMINAEKWWGIIGTYGKNIFPLQIVTVIAAVIIVWLVLKKPGDRANILIKAFFSICFAWIGCVFFLIHGKDFPGIQSYIQAGLFITIAILFAVDLFRKRINFQMPMKGWRSGVTVTLLFTVLVYPLVGLLAGHYFPRMIIVGTHPCPTAAFALVLLAAALPRTNKLLYVLLLIWAIPFPLFIQIPKFGVYEDSIMFLCGVYALFMLVKAVGKKKNQAT
jgi:hypothetical protein